MEENENPRTQKNVLEGNISNVGSVRIGDEYHHHEAPKPSIPKPLTAKIPRTAPEKIIGRQAELEDLRQRLFANKQVVLVNGLGGIGKTTLAQVYLDRYWEAYQHVAWISLVSEDILSDFVTTEGLLESLNISNEGKDSQALFLEILGELKMLEGGPNLLVLDNATPSLAQVYDYLPGQPAWHILVTSRAQIPRFDLKELGFLSLDEAIALFRSHYTRRSLSDADIRELVETVDLHTLTIEILAKTAQVHRTPPDQLKKAIEDDLRGNVYIKHKGDKIERVTSYLTSIFTMSQLNDREIWLLKQFTALPPDFHLYDLLLDLIHPDDAYAEAFSETLEALAAKGWLLNAQDTYKMHRIIATVVCKQQTLTVEDLAPLIGRITSCLRVDQTKDNPVEKFRWIPFGIALLAPFPDSLEADIATLQNNLALRLKDLGDYAGAKGLLEKAMRSDEQNFGPEHPTTAVSYSNLALVLQDLGELEEALDYSGRAVRIFQQRLPEGHPYIQLALDIYHSIEGQIQNVA